MIIDNLHYVVILITNYCLVFSNLVFTYNLYNKIIVIV